MPVLHRLSEDDRFVSRTCHSGQHRELLEPVLALADIRPDHVLDVLHFAPTPRAVEALIRENIDPASVHQTGNTVIDALQWISRPIDREPALASGLKELEQRLSGKRIIGVTTNRRKNFGKASTTSPKLCTGSRSATMSA